MHNPFGNLKIYQLADGKPVRSIGEPSRNIWILLEPEDLQKTDNLDLLNKILKAIKIDLETDTFQMAIDRQQPIQLTQMLTAFPSEKTIISFGIEPSSLGLSLQQRPYHPFTIRQTRFLFSHDLNSISGNPDFKRSLWNALQDLTQTTT